MAYTVAQTIAQAELGNAIQITNITGDRQDVNIEIGGRTITLSPEHATKDVTNGIKTSTTTNLRVLDLGTRFTANDVLQSVSLMKAIEDEIVSADAGTVALSRQVIV